MTALQTLLVCLLIVPVVGAAIAALLGRQRPAIRWVSLVATLIGLVIAIVLTINFTQISPVRQTEAVRTFQPRIAVQGDLLRFQDPAEPVQGPRLGPIQFYLGLDGLNVWLVLLTAVLMVSAVLVSWTAIEERANEYYAWLLALQAAMTGVFLAFDIVLFYVFFELTLVPLFFLIGIWGGPQRQHAARKFFLFTLTGSLITFLGVLGLVAVCYTDLHELTFSIPRLVQLVNTHLTDRHQLQFWIFLALMTGFAIKVPLVPVHTWLPLAHVEAPTAGSVLLAGLLLKVGTYGFLRLCLPLAPDAALSFGVWFIGTLAVIGIIYGAFCSLAQNDIKKLVAYSSVSHLGFCMLGLFALNEAGISGSLLQMINHGLSTGALFLLVGMLYERYHTRLLADYGGMASRLHLMACFWVFVCLTSIGLPGLNGFVGEVLVLMGMYDLKGAPANGPLFVAVAVFGVLLGAWYLLTLLQRVFFGPLKEPHHEGHGPVGDLNLRELAALLPIAVLCVAIGVYPQPFFDTIKDDLHVVTRITDLARERAAGTATAQAPAEEPLAASRLAIGEKTP
jgi:NADH-quinone oxidoreductase subunit M